LWASVLVSGGLHYTASMMISMRSGLTGESRNGRKIKCLVKNIVQDIAAVNKNVPVSERGMFLWPYSEARQVSSQDVLSQNQKGGWLCREQPYKAPLRHLQNSSGFLSFMIGGKCLEMGPQFQVICQ
jgi:hypothetical protein